MSGMYIRFTSQEAFEAWHAQVNAALGYPNASTCTEGYTQVLTGVDGMLYAPFNDTCPQMLLEGMDIVEAFVAEATED